MRRLIVAHSDEQGSAESQSRVVRVHARDGRRVLPEAGAPRLPYNSQWASLEIAGDHGIFALLKTMFGDQQMSSLADYIEAALMLSYNGRKIG